MKIQEALKETGKAEEIGRSEGVHVEIQFQRGANYLVWVNNETNKVEDKVSYEWHFKDNWQPYHDKPVIRPEKEGEFWTNDHNIKWFIYFERDRNRGLKAVSEQGVFRDVEEMNMIHNQNGWTRLYLNVEDEKEHKDG